jgi:predicted regulator of Ras-like GTPase activity (Roadblock/LC7/MglB family)
LNTARTDVADGLSAKAEDLQWLLSNLIDEAPGVQSVAVVSADGVLVASSDAANHRPPEAGGRGPAGSAAQLSAVVSGLASLTEGSARLMEWGQVKQTVVTMDGGHLLVMAISDGSLLGVHASPECDLGSAGYHMTLFVRRAGHVLTPELRGELQRTLEL